MPRAERVTSVALAMVLGLVPLLPTGPRYLGLDSGNVIDAAVVVLLVLWLIVRVTRRGVAIAEDGNSADAAVRRAWIVWIAAATGATIAGLAAENRIGSPVFAAHLPNVISGVLRPVELTSAPFYPARVWLTFLEGALVFAVVRDCCIRARSPRQFARVAAWGWVAGLAVVSTLAIVQYVGRVQLDPEWVTRNPDLIRASATFDDPNALGSYLVLGVGIAIGIALSAHRRTPAIVALAVVLLACVALITTVSRAALLALPLAALLLVSCAPIRNDYPALRITRLRRATRMLLIGCALLGGMLLLARLVLPEQAVARPTSPLEALAQTLDPRVPLDDVLRNRLAYWAAALRMIGQDPVTGAGLGRYPRLLPEFRSHWIPLDNAHNFFLQVFAEMGVVGAAAFVFLLMMSLALFARGVRGPNRDDAGFDLGVLLGTLAHAITLLAGHPLVLPSGQILWASALALGGMATGPGYQASRTSGRRLMGPATLASLLVVGGYLLAAWRTPPPPRQSDPWGYSWGLFPEEWSYFSENLGLPLEKDPTAPGPPGTRGARFRWTGEQAIVELQAPRNATECSLAFAALLPSRGMTQRVQVSFGDTAHVVDLRTSDPHIVRVPLTDALLDSSRRFVARITVMPSFVPADLGLSPDRRRLGLQLFRPRCENRGGSG